MGLVDSGPPVWPFAHSHTTLPHVSIHFYSLAGPYSLFTLCFCAFRAPHCVRAHHKGDGDERRSRSCFNLKLKALLTGWMSFTSTSLPPSGRFVAVVMSAQASQRGIQRIFFFGWPDSHVRGNGVIVSPKPLLNSGFQALHHVWKSVWPSRYTRKTFI